MNLGTFDNHPNPPRKEVLMMSLRSLAAVAVSMFLASVAPAQPAPQAEPAQTSKLTGTSFGATPERDLRPQVI